MRDWIKCDGNTVLFFSLNIFNPRHPYYYRYIIGLVETESTYCNVLDYSISARFIKHRRKQWGRLILKYFRKQGFDICFQVYPLSYHIVCIPAEMFVCLIFFYINQVSPCKDLWNASPKIVYLHIWRSTCALLLPRMAAAVPKQLAYKNKVLILQLILFLIFCDRTDVIGFGEEQGREARSISPRISLLPALACGVLMPVLATVRVRCELWWMVPYYNRVVILCIPHTSPTTGSFWELLQSILLYPIASGAKLLIYACIPHRFEHCVIAGDFFPVLLRFGCATTCECKAREPVQNSSCDIYRKTPTNTPPPSHAHAACRLLQLL